jgi:hypothetical protein
MRHQPTERRLAAALPGLRLTRPDLFNAYQEWQRFSLFNPRGIEVVASFVADGTGRAVFAGLWKLEGRLAASDEQWQTDARNVTLIELGMADWTDRPRHDRARYKMTEIEHLADNIGRLLVHWKPAGQTWCQRGDRKNLPVLAIHEENIFDPASKPWDEIDLSWAELATLPPRRKLQLAEWRGIYLIFDEIDGKGYVGSASGEANILGRWKDYAVRSDGGNRLLRNRDPATFRFSILQRVSPDMPRDEVEAIEASWKRRLHTLTHGLNAN